MKRCYDRLETTLVGYLCHRLLLPIKIGGSERLGTGVINNYK